MDDSEEGAAQYCIKVKISLVRSIDTMRSNNNKALVCFWLLMLLPLSSAGASRDQETTQQQKQGEMGMGMRKGMGWDGRGVCEEGHWSKTWSNDWCIMHGTCNKPCIAEGYDAGHCVFLHNCICTYNCD